MTPPFTRTARQHGFSLIELLVAMGVTVLIGAMAWQFIDSAVEVSERSERILTDVEALDQFWQVLEQDLHHSLAAPEGTEVSAPMGPGFSGGAALLETTAATLPAGSQPLLQLLRHGHANPLQQQRSDLQGVLYQWQDGTVERGSWPQRNEPGPPQAMQRRLLLSGVDAITVSFFPPGGRDLQQDWVADWPGRTVVEPGKPATEPELPLAVRVVLQMEGLGDVERLFTLPGV